MATLPPPNEKSNDNVKDDLKTLKSPEEILEIAAKCKKNLYGSVHSAHLIFQALVHLSNPKLPELDYKELRETIAAKQKLEEKTKKEQEDRVKLKEMEVARKMEREYLRRYKHSLDIQNRWECKQCHCIYNEGAKVCMACNMKREQAENKLEVSSIKEYDDRSALWKCEYGCDMPAGLKHCINHRKSQRPPVPAKTRQSSRSNTTTQLGYKIHKELMANTRGSASSLRVYKTLFSNYHHSLTKSLEELDGCVVKDTPCHMDKSDDHTLAQLRKERDEIQEEINGKNEALRALAERLKEMQRDITISLRE